MLFPRLVLATTLTAGLLAAQTTVIGVGYSVPYPLKVAPGQLVIIFAKGIGATLTMNSEAAITVLPSQRLPFSPIFAGLTVGFSGLYQINFLAPAPPTPFGGGDCATFGSPNGNVAITLRDSSADTAAVCIAP